MKISIITITYNSEKTIEETILSVINQNYSNLEYIIIDGKSNDKTMDIIKKYKDKINIVISEPDNGISSAFNKGIKLATGDIIGIINSDDFLNKDALEKLSNFVKKNPRYDVYYGNSIMFDNEFNYIYKPSNNIEKLKLNMIISHPSTFIKKETYKKYGLYNEEYKCAMDFELLSKIYIKGGKFIHINEELTWFRLGGTSQKKSEITKLESINIAVRNGVNEKNVQKWYRKVYQKEKMKFLLHQIKIEKLLRKILKKQNQTKISKNWFEIREKDKEKTLDTEKLK